MTTAFTDTAPEAKAQPRDHDGWLVLAREVAAELAEDAAERDRAGRPPFEEIEYLRTAGLLTLLIPAERGGGGATWRTAYQVTREIAAADGGIGQLLGYHYLLSWNLHFFGSPQLQERVERQAAAARWLWGGAFNPRDPDLTLTPRPTGGFELNGTKTFATGARVGDRLAVGATRADTGEPLVVIANPLHPGVTRPDDWDNIGQRLSASGSVSFAAVPVAAEDVIGSLENPSPWVTLVTPAIQLVFVQFYLGIAEGALASARDYTRTTTRPWLLSGVERAVDDPYVLATYGELVARLRAARALADQAIEEIEPALHGPGREDLTEERRGELAVLVATAKVAATEASLTVASRIFEVTGARSTRAALALDRFWRNARTHTLHDPVAYKQREVGAHFLTGEFPPFTLYT
ncbi:Acyl-CoA dehydrogenase [Thermomonospora echinospora]|uniref:Acyl-CoA dehydrogenase n=1 Tax=Thermomonospora echinospora TaxID=1992 RepID=A0A1H6B288_9ACTN|nr:acyl-CoA dehydrogenase family protein [Thermomonospora echinospora]SEG54445.1 Acyl-CoA dehydrogenase [Thermomonospora echinospora]